MGWLELVQVQCSFFSVSFSWSINYFLSPLGLRLVTANLEAAINKTAKSFADLIQFFLVQIITCVKIQSYNANPES